MTQCLASLMVSNRDRVLSGPLSNLVEVINPSESVTVVDLDIQLAARSHISRNATVVRIGIVSMRLNHLDARVAPATRSLGQRQSCFEEYAKGITASFCTLCSVVGRIEFCLPAFGLRAGMKLDFVV